MANLKEKIAAFKQTLAQKLARVEDEQQLEKIRITYLGRQGMLTELMSILASLAPEEKRIYGPLLNELKQHSLQAFEEKRTELLEQEFKRAQEREKFFDVTAYKPHQLFGSLHPYTQIIERLEDIFISMGYEIVDGPEVEHERYNFDALNIPKHHPARDLADTFWLQQPSLLLRTHTSSVQARVMAIKKPPLAVVSLGRVFRHEATDATHDFMFLQCEGLFIDKHVSLSNLIASIEAFLQKIFDAQDLHIRTRPYYFPFVEPGIEVDISCPFCTTGCSVCKKTRWIELGGAGLVHPNVLSFSGIDPEEYRGFAWGFGISRIAMLKFGINDIRLLHSGNKDFLTQF